MAITAYDRPLELIDQEPEDVGPGQVAIRIQFSGVCRTDLKTARGQRSFSDEIVLPHIPGHEIAGTIEEVGDGVTFEVGTPAIVYSYQACGSCPGCRDGHENRCDSMRMWLGSTHPGGFQERIVVAEQCVLPVPPSVDMAKAATLPCGVGTAYHATVAQADVRPGQRIAVIGCGGVGVHAVQIAKIGGAAVAVIDPSERARSLALDQGASVALNPLNDATPDQLREFAPQGLDAVIETSGAPGMTMLAAKSVRRGGRVVMVGYREDRPEEPFPQADVVLREISMLGSRGKSRGELMRLIELLAAGVIDPVVSEVLPLTEINTIFDRLETGDIVGRQVLAVGTDAATGAGSRA